MTFPSRSMVRSCQLVSIGTFHSRSIVRSCQLVSIGTFHSRSIVRSCQLVSIGTFHSRSIVRSCQLVYAFGNFQIEVKQLSAGKNREKKLSDLKNRKKIREDQARRARERVMSSRVMVLSLFTAQDMYESLSVTCRRSVVSSGFSSFLL